VKRYAVYRRVSTEEQSRPGHVSLEAQTGECRRHVIERGGEVVLEAEDVQSGLEPARPGYQQILAAAQRGDIDAVVVFRFDRWGRDAGEALTSFTTLQRVGITVESVMEPTDDPFLRGLFTLLGFRESQATSQRTIAGLRRRAAKGEWSGPAPLGYNVVRTNGRSVLEIDPETAGYVRRLFEDAATGEYSLAELADRAAARGMRGRRGFVIPRQGLSRMLRNPVYRGAVAYGRSSQSKFAKVGSKPREEWIIVDGAHSPLVDLATFEAVQLALARHRQDQGTIRKTLFLLTSLTYCARCDGQPGPTSPAGRSWRVYGHGSKGGYYQCSRSRSYGRRLCDLPIISGPGLEAAVKQAVTRTFALLEDDGIREDAALLVAQEVEELRGAAEKQRLELQRARERHQTQRMNLARRLLGVAGEAIPEDIYRRLEEDEALAIRRIDEELSGLPAEAAPLDVEPIFDALASLEWADLTWEGWRQILVLLVQRIELRGRGNFKIVWQPAAEQIQSALYKLSSYGSRMFG
jgi:site-specific DNA recombinase